MKKFEEFLNEAKVTLDAEQIETLAHDVYLAVGKFKPTTMDDVNDMIGNMGEDIPGFTSADFTAIVKSYKAMPGSHKK